MPVTTRPAWESNTTHGRYLAPKQCGPRTDQREFAENLATMIDARVLRFVAAATELGIGTETAMFGRHWAVELRLASTMPAALEVRKNGTWQFIRYVYDQLGAGGHPEGEPVFTAASTKWSWMPRSPDGSPTTSRAERTYGLLSALALAFSPSSTDSG